jgi:hypothetical protein
VKNDLDVRTALFYGVGLVIACAGIGLAVIGSDRLASVGLTLVNLSALVGVAGYFAGKRANLDDAFEAGYQAGFHRGERAKPKVLRMDRGQSA